MFKYKFLSASLVVTIAEDIVASTNAGVLFGCRKYPLTNNLFSPLVAFVNLATIFLFWSYEKVFVVSLASLTEPTLLPFAKLFFNQFKLLNGYIFKNVGSFVLVSFKNFSTFSDNLLA